jgi:gas vesicle structural protein
MPRPTRSRTAAARILDNDQASLLDVVDSALTKGVVLRGDLTLALAHVDLVYVRLAMLLCAADRVMPQSATTTSGRRRLRLRRGIRRPP